jgi:hypothetical protein
MCRESHARWVLRRTPAGRDRVSKVLIIRSPLDIDRLKVAIGEARQVQFDEPLTDAEYRLLAQLLDQHPQVTLRAYGFTTDLAGMGFLRFLPKLRRFSMSHLDHATDAAPLNALPDDLQPRPPH